MRTDDRTSFRVTPQAVIALVIILFGLVLTGDNLGWVNSDRVFGLWPLAVVVIGLAVVAQGGSRSRTFAGWVITGIGALFTTAVVFEMPLRLGDWWPIVFVAMGIIMLLRAFGRDEAKPAVGDQVISDVAIWSGTQRRVSSPAFRRGDLTAIMGGVEIDLRTAGTANGEAVIDVFVLWGGIEIRVPPDWDVSNQVIAIMGAAEDKSTGTQDARHRLVLRGFVLMGGVEVKT
jgi:predicted membrane protein